ncbi:DUF349 domain-containing protein [Glaciimonas sp. GG7]
MFGFLFKRADRSAATAQAEAAEKARQQTDQRVASAQVTDTARQQALTQAAALNDESAAVSFILQAAFADARLQAAQLVHSASGLEQVLQGMRNVDRRVAKLMQSRLELLRQQQQTSAQASVCIEQAQRLLKEPQLLPNQVTDLDRAWQLIGHSAEIAQLQQQEFQQISVALADRLAAQAALQHAVMGLLSRMRALTTQISGDAESESQIQTVASVAEQAEQCAAQIREHESNLEAISLPKNLADQCGVALQTLLQRLQTAQQRQQVLKNTLETRQELLAQWEAMPADKLSPDVLWRSWGEVASLPVELIDETVEASDTAELSVELSVEQRYQILLQRIAEAKSNAPTQPQPSVLPDAESNSKPAPAIDKVATQAEFATALEGLETALEEGALQAGMDYDKTLRAIDFKALKMTASQNTRLTQARSELGRLQGWARWGGNVSREELMKAAQELPGQELAVTELAKKIGSLRARWKSLDTSAGSAPKALWEGFDAACTAAYIPVAAHFQQLAQERQRNQIKALLLIEEIQQYATVALGEVTDAGPDWKAIAQFCQQKQQAWRAIGTINRSDKKALDKSFSSVSQQLLAPLMQQQQRGIAQREKLIVEVSELTVNQRDTTERLRQLQQRWQEQAKTLPLSRQDEQQLWQRFRSACDAIFAQRKEAASSADTERRQNLQLKEAVCVSLETTTTQAENTIPAMLRQAQQDWNKIGFVPRAVEAQIEARFNAAVAHLQALVDQARHNAVMIEAHALCDKLALCQLLEVSLRLDHADMDGNPDVWSANWQALPMLPSAFEKAMRSRFDAAMQLHKAAERQATDAYLVTLENNRETLLQELLRAEIIAGVESPVSMTRERLQVQVEVLQAALKAGSAEISSSAQLLRTCGLPALMDSETRERAEQLILSVKGPANA